jgi:UDP-GlcNAc:undecaprenyl-phosphate GlcNAc-1-phosphate transferase
MSVKNTSVSALILILIFAVPILDITQVVVTRLIRGVSPFSGGRDHLSHLLLKLGLREKEVLFILVLISIFCSVIAVILLRIM